MKKLGIIFLTIFLLIPLSGCWGSHQLDSYAIVQGVGIDLTEDNQVQLTFQMLKPQQIKSPSAGGGGGGSAGGKAVWTLTSVGETFFDALRKATLQSDRRLYMGQLKIIVLGETVARAGITPFLDFLYRDYGPRFIAYCFITPGKAQNILEAEHEQESIPATAIEKLAKESINTSLIPGKTRTLDVVKTLNSDTSDPTLAGIDLIPSADKEKKKDLVKLDNTAIFKKDKLVGWFDGKEMRGVLWLRGEVKGGDLVVKSPSTSEQKFAKQSIRITRAKSKISPEMINQKLTLTVDIKVEGNVAEQMDGIDLTKPESIKEINKEAEVAILEEINSALTKAQKWGVDIFGFGVETHKKLPQEWPALKDNWQEEFQNLEVVVNVEADLKGTGVITNIIKPKE